MRINNLDKFKPKSGGTEVLDDSWAVKNTGTLYTASIEANIVVAVLNERSGVGYLGNFSPILISHNERYKHFLERLRDTESNSRLGIWLGGVALIDGLNVNAEDAESYHYESNHSTMLVENDMRSVSNDTDMRTEWLGINGRIGALELNCADGVLRYYNDR